MSTGVRVQTYMRTREVTAGYPHCDKEQYGFIGNPVGGEFNCEDCGEPFKVHQEADIEFR